MQNSLEKRSGGSGLLRFTTAAAIGAGATLYWLARRGNEGADEGDDFLDYEMGGQDAQLVGELMTRNPTVCNPDTPLAEAARLMSETDCGALPVVSDEDDEEIVGILTDRDIVIRTLAEGLNPMELTAGDAMTAQTITIAEDASIEECCDLMESEQIRRIPVVDAQGRCVGILAQADLALEAPEEAADLVREVSDNNSIKGETMAKADKPNQRREGFRGTNVNTEGQKTLAATDKWSNAGDGKPDEPGNHGEGQLGDREPREPQRSASNA